MFPMFIWSTRRRRIHRHWFELYVQRDVDREDIDSQTMDFAKTLVNVE